MKSILEKIKQKASSYDLSVSDNIFYDHTSAYLYLNEILVNMVEFPEMEGIANLPSEIKNRSCHIASTFLLGLIIADFCGLKELIEKKYEKFFKKKGNIFLKVWMIISIYHDYGYFQLSKYENIEKLDDFNCYYNIFNWIDRDQEWKKIYKFNDIEMDNLRYSEETIKAYFEAITKKRNPKEPFDHGIGGGYLLFDMLMKDNDAVNEDRLIKSLLGIAKAEVKSKLFYKDISFRIMEHNVWKQNEKSTYFEQSDMEKLQEITGSNFKKISVNEPLLFLLCLVDTIEVVKRMHDNLIVKNQDIFFNELQKIIITVSEQEIVIESVMIKEEGPYNQWKSGILGLEDWLVVETESKLHKIVIKKDNKYSKWEYNSVYSFC